MGICTSTRRQSQTLFLSWPIAISKLLHGDIESIVAYKQYERLVFLIGKNGKRYKTVEPHVGDVVYFIQRHRLNVWIDTD